MTKWWRNDDEMMTKWWRNDDEMMTKWWRNDDEMMTKWWQNQLSRFDGFKVPTQFLDILWSYCLKDVRNHPMVLKCCQIILLSIVYISHLRNHLIVLKNVWRHPIVLVPVLKNVSQNKQFPTMDNINSYIC